MTLEQVQKRRQDLVNQATTLQNQITQGNAQLNAIGGAIQDCDYWIAELTKPADAPVENPSN